MKSGELMLKVENVSKVYKLGEIGGTTLRDELQRIRAKVFRKEDPTKKIGTKNYNKGEKFYALTNVSFEVKRGERVGIIGHNGAGKSTLLKLISRVTGPSDGRIFLNGRVASMLEVGTGFHPELTGRENIYMNGAILGMTKKEIDKKIEDIIDFSEVRQFIDTPVKRYSSGMYVKLAFSVVAHLDSEIAIMDEVLAVGDMDFQKKCLKKMKTVSEQEDKTVLYVSHNMNTIRELCNRVIVLSHGQIIFDGDVETGIEFYINDYGNHKGIYYDLSKQEHNTNSLKEIDMIDITLLSKENNVYRTGEELKFVLNIETNKEYKNLRGDFVVLRTDEQRIARTCTNCFNLARGKSSLIFTIDTSSIADGNYFLEVSIIDTGKHGEFIKYAGVYNALYFSIINIDPLRMNRSWNQNTFGNVVLPIAKIDINN